VRKVLLNWPADVFYGWGIVGLNLFLHWANDPDIRGVMGQGIAEMNFAALDPLRISACREALAESNAFQGRLRSVGGTRLAFPVVDGLGNGLTHPGTLTGSVTFGRCVFEDTRLADLDGKLAKYDGLVVASEWNAALLRANTRKPVTLIHEGIDPSLFHPGPRSGLLDSGRFYVFSGGKVEFRKGHDLTLAAFREFSRRHDDAVLVTMWHSRWPELSVGFQGRLAVPLGRNPRGGLDFARWLAENGVDPRKAIELPRTPNPLMPVILREMDCALAPSRAEACTNLVAKEAMACGVPMIIAANTGVLDLVDEGNCIPLTRQASVMGVADAGTEGWGESDADEIVAALETLYTNSERRRTVARRGAQWILERGRTWTEHARALKTLILSA
jgi:glycosyltransferase involved in cell wall biosynthesis